MKRAGFFPIFQHLTMRFGRAGRLTLTFHSEIRTWRAECASRDTGVTPCGVLRSAASPGSVGFGRSASGESGLLITPLPTGHVFAGGWRYGRRMVPPSWASSISVTTPAGTREAFSTSGGSLPSVRVIASSVFSQAMNETSGALLE